MTKIVKNENAAVVKVIRDYDGRPLEAGEKLALFPYNPEIDDVSNSDNICFITRLGRSFHACKKAVPADWASEANSQFVDWQEEILPDRRDGRCMIPQPDGTLKECPRKKGDNHCTCAKCPDKDKYERKNKSFVSLDHAQDEYEYAFATIPSAADVYFEKEDFSESQQLVINTVESLIEYSPKHAFAMLLEGLGYKGDAFAERMKMSKPGANYVRKQVSDFAPDGICNFGQIDFSSLKANKSKDDEYYRQEAKKALKALIEMYF